MDTRAGKRNERKRERARKWRRGSGGGGEERGGRKGRRKEGKGRDEAINYPLNSFLITEHVKL